EDGTARRMIGTIQDITERKTAESQIRESEENFRALIEASTLFTWTVDEAGVGTELFDWFGEMSGRKIESVHDIIEIIHSDDLGRDYAELCGQSIQDFGSAASDVSSAIRDVLSGARKNFSLEYRHRGGERDLWFYMNVTPLQTREGGAVVSHTDITDQKLAEE